MWVLFDGGVGVAGIAGGAGGYALCATTVRHRRACISKNSLLVVTDLEDKKLQVKCTYSQARTNIDSIQPYALFKRRPYLLAT
jgi:hypothetical protein